MSDSASGEQRRSRGFVGFLSTVPGILTAVAAVVTAVGGVYVGASRDGTSPVPTPAPTQLTVNLRMDGGAPPPRATQVAAGSLRLDDVDSLPSGDPVQGLVDACAQGDDGACTQILDQLTLECSDGDGLSCDVLYAVSPSGTEYESFGASCGYRFTVDYAGTCEQQ